MIYLVEFYDTIVRHHVARYTTWNHINFDWKQKISRPVSSLNQNIWCKKKIMRVFNFMSA